MTKTMTRERAKEIITEFLTDYNDNFIGKPCDEIVEEVLSHIPHLEYTDRLEVITRTESIVYELYE